MEKILIVLLIMVFCYLSFVYAIFRKHKKFYKNIESGETGMRCKYWINEDSHYGKIQYYNKETGKVTVTGFHGSFKIYLQDIKPPRFLN